MAIWKRSTSAPVTVEREVRVYDMDSPDREGYVRLNRNQTGNRFHGCVYTKECDYNPDGSIAGERVGEILDRDPQFA